MCSGSGETAKLPLFMCFFTEWLRLQGLAEVPSATSRQLWEIPKEETLQPLGSLCQCSITSQHRRAPGVQREPPVLQFVPTAPCPGTGHHWKKSGFIFFAPSLTAPLQKLPLQCWWWSSFLKHTICCNDRLILDAALFIGTTFYNPSAYKIFCKRLPRG